MGWTPLHNAAAYGRASLVGPLLAARADVNLWALAPKNLWADVYLKGDGLLLARCERGDTPLHLGVRGDCFGLLLVVLPQAVRAQTEEENGVRKM